MYRKRRRRRQRFYPEFYNDDEIENETGKTEAEPAPVDPAGRLDPPRQVRAPANYNDLLYPSNIKPASVSKQLENMQKDYIKKKLEIAQANTIDINDITQDITGSDKNINRNEAANISGHNEITIQIPDSMYNGYTEETKKPEEVFEETETTQTEEVSNDEPIEELIETESESEAETAGTEPEAEQPDEIEIFEHTETEQSEQSEQPEQPESMPIQITEPTITEPETRSRSQPGLTPFDRVKAIEYAHRWALDRNPSFLDFDELGGDCTNYISQILLAGGCQMDYTPVFGWYYSSGSEKSPSWTGVEQLYNYLIKEKETGVIAQEISAEEAEPGDIVQFSFNGRNFQHTPFIVGVSRSPGAPFSFDSIKICAHSFDSQNRALDTYQWRKIRFIRILGYK